MALAPAGADEPLALRHTTHMRKRFCGRVVLITGAAGGFGRASALRFAREGAELILADLNEADLEETADDIRKSGAACLTHKLDLANESDISAFGAQICASHPKLHVLFNNADIACDDATDLIETVSQGRWLRYLYVNSLAPLLLAQAVRPALASAKGVVINQSSMADYVPGAPYRVTKAALIAITIATAGTFGADGIRVNGIAPGIMETPPNKRGLRAETYARVQRTQMLQLQGIAEDVAALALFLASDDARSITSEIVSCNGGNRMWEDS